MYPQAAEKPDIREFTAEVTAIEDNTVQLSETYFYPASGGQPADRGTISGVTVEMVAKSDGSIIHHLRSEPELAVGDTVTGRIDDTFRVYCMRAHSASHTLYGAARTLFNELGYGGFEITPEKIRVDLSTEDAVDAADVVELERLTNQAIWDSRPVSWREVPVSEAQNNENIAFNTQTEEGVMTDQSAVRLVEIKGWDIAACGGTHVSNTIEIGPVTVLNRSNPGEGLTRVEFAVGPPAIQERATHHQALTDVTTCLGTNVSELSETAQHLQNERNRLENELQAAQQQYVDSALDTFETFSRDGDTWQLGMLSDVDPNTVGEILKERVNEHPQTIYGAILDGTSVRVVFAVGERTAPGADEIVNTLTSEFGGGGGGKATFAQGGGIGAAPQSIVEHLREQ